MTTMSDDTRQQLLAAIDFFSGCTDHQLRGRSRLTEERAVAAGAQLCQQGELENEVYVVVAGEADVVVDGAEVGQTHVGEIVGDLAMLGNGSRAATIQGRTALRVLVLDPARSTRSSRPTCPRHGGSAPRRRGLTRPTAT